MLDPQEISILIVDDMENMSKSIRAMLKILKIGKTFRYATNGKKAWNMIKSESIDLAMIDWNMPVMSGIELLELIRKDKGLRDLPVIMITAEGTRDVVAEAGEYDIDAYILKPLTVKSLGEKILAVIQRTNYPPESIIHLKKSRDLHEAGKLDEAIAEAKLAMQADPNSTRPIRSLAYLYYQANDIEKAEKLFYKAATMNRNDVFAFHYLGEIYFKKDQLDKALKFFEKAISISPRHVDRGLSFGKILIQKQHYSKAKSVFDHILQFADNTLVLKEEIAELYFSNNCYDYALESYEFLIKQFPTRKDFLYKLGVIYKHQDNQSKAIEYLNKAEKEDPKNIDIKFHLVDLYSALGKKIKTDDLLNDIHLIYTKNEVAKKRLSENL